jgi:hypothetical protein
MIPVPKPKREVRKPLVRRTRPKAKGRSRFPKRRNPAYIAWIRMQPCTVQDWFDKFTQTNHRCISHPDRRWIEPAHIKTQGSGGDDVGNVIPLCPAAHDQQEGKNVQFERRYGIDLKTTAAGYALVYRGEV